METRTIGYWASTSILALEALWAAWWASRMDGRWLWPARPSIT